MPIYEYACGSCGYEWEEMQKIKDDPLSTCPDCNAAQAHRLISRTSFVLKGSGWYVTDYGRGTGGQAGEQKKTPKAEKEESTSTKSTSSTTTTSSDTSTSTTASSTSKSSSD